MQQKFGEKMGKRSGGKLIITQICAVPGSFAALVVKTLAQKGGHGNLRDFGCGQEWVVEICHGTRNEFCDGRIFVQNLNMRIPMSLRIADDSRFKKINPEGDRNGFSLDRGELLIVDAKGKGLNFFILETGALVFAGGDIIRPGDRNGFRFERFVSNYADGVTGKIIHWLEKFSPDELPFIPKARKGFGRPEERPSKRRNSRGVRRPQLIGLPQSP